MSLRTIGDVIECLTLQKSNLPLYQTQVGATAGDIARVNEHLNILETLAQHCGIYDANKRTAFAVKEQVLRGVVGETVASVPTTPANTPSRRPRLASPPKFRPVSSFSKATNPMASSPTSSSLP